MNVLSLFDGMSCGQVALDKLDIKCKNYYASELCRYAIKVTQENYPKTRQLGDVMKINYNDLPQMDLLLGGSPCQDLTSVNVYSEIKGLGGKKSSLFWEFVRAKNEGNPRYFLFENVGSAKKKDIAIIDRELGVRGVSLNSKLFVPQHRNRVYWTNIPVNPVTSEMTLTMQDLLQDSIEDKYYLSEKMHEYVMSEGTKDWQSGKLETDLSIARPLTATMHKMHRADTDNYVTMPSAPEGRTNLRKLTPVECERLQGLDDNYSECVSNTRRYQMIGNGWTIGAIMHLLSPLKGIMA